MQEVDALKSAAQAYVDACDGKHPDPDTAMSKLVKEAVKIAPVIGIKVG